ncbi:MAG: hypothetical protein IT406_01265 [Candidatus Yanofskybacteria bacterium]|nr:hypothetical protein [Candidatus Yanofskybacteria bacterium]
MEYESLDEFRERAGYLIDGVWYPRVTSIVSIKAKPALYRYYGGMRSFKAADDAKEASAREGTMVHEAVEAILNGTHEPVPATIEPSIDAFREFLRNNHVEPLLIEERVVSRNHRYAGTIDALARINGVVGVLDIKTSKSVYRDYGMQIAAYIAALTETPDIEQPITSWVLRLDQCRTCQLCGVSLRTKGGVFRVSAGGKGCLHQWGPMEGRFEFVEFGTHAHDLNAFLAAKTLWEWEHHDLLSQLS